MFSSSVYQQIQICRLTISCLEVWGSIDPRDFCSCVCPLKENLLCLCKAKVFRDFLYYFSRDLFIKEKLTRGLFVVLKLDISFIQQGKTSSLATQMLKWVVFSFPLSLQRFKDVQSCSIFNQCFKIERMTKQGQNYIDLSSRIFS